MDFVDNVNSITTSYLEDDDVANVILVDQISNSIGESAGSDKLDNFNSSVLLIFAPEGSLANFSIAPDILNASEKSAGGYRDSLSIIIPISLCYFIIFVTGILGNVITCVVIAKNKTMHTATNYYLFNLAVSDFFVLIIGMPFDFLNIWYPNSYPFDETVCVLQGLLSETSTNATILTITSFTCERYIAICHPFRSHTMSKLSRVVRFIFAIWILAFALAMPQAFQFGTVDLYGGVSCTAIKIVWIKRKANDATSVILNKSPEYAMLEVKTQYIEHAFEISSFLFFIVPMTVICVLYILIGIKLRQSKLLYGKKMKTCDSQRCIKGQSRVIRMLIAVVVTFFLCWAPFHAQRIMAVYGKIMEKSFSSDDLFMRVYIALTYISGISYFLSTCINPFLYNIMSHKFRNASKLTLFVHCLSRTPSSKQTQLGSNYSALTLKFGAMEPTRMTTLNRNPFAIQQSTSEIIQVNGVRNIEDERNFDCRAGDVSPFLMENPYQSVVRLTPPYGDAVNFSCSQQTTLTTLSRENSVRFMKNRVISTLEPLTQPNDSRMNSFTDRLKKCTQKVLIFKSDVNTLSSNETLQLSNDVSKGKAQKSLSNSSLKEMDEEEHGSAERVQIMFDGRNQQIIQKLPTQMS